MNAAYPYSPHPFASIVAAPSRGRVRGLTRYSDICLMCWHPVHWGGGAAGKLEKKNLGTKMTKSGAKLSAAASRWANRGAISPGDPREEGCMTAERRALTTIAPGT